MSYCINGVMCDTYAYLDQRRVGETVRISASDVASHTIVAFLYCDNKAFPLSSQNNLTVLCCIKHCNGKKNTECSIGNSGEIIIPLSDELCTVGQSLSCEINVSGVSGSDSFRYKAFDFFVAIVP